MNKGKYLFAQIMELIHPQEFDRGGAKYNGNFRVRQLSCWHQFLSLSFGQLTHRESQIGLGLIMSVFMRPLCY